MVCKVEVKTFRPAVSGYPCPRCGGRARAYKTMPHSNGELIRYRKCELCGHKFTTRETR